MKEKAQTSWQCELEKLRRVIWKRYHAFGEWIEAQGPSESELRDLLVVLSRDFDELKDDINFSLNDYKEPVRKPRRKSGARAGLARTGSVNARPEKREKGQPAKSERLRG